MNTERESAPRRKLSDARLRTLTQPGKYADGDVPGLYLEVKKPQKSGKPGSKLWRVKYRLDGKENRVERNVALSNSEELKIRHVVNSNPAIEKPDDLGVFMRRLDDLNDNSVSMALRLLVMLPVRPGELAVMRWEDIELTGADWRFIVGKTRHLSKTKHIVPLPTQAVAILRRMQKHAVLDDQGKGWVVVSPVYPAPPSTPPLYSRRCNVCGKSTTSPPMGFVQLTEPSLMSGWE